MKSVGITFLLLSAVAVAVASSTTAKLFIVNALACLGEYSLHANIAYGSLPRQNLDLYVPHHRQGNRPTLIFIPGGCWGACETLPKHDYRFVADSFASRGYGVVVVNYRLFPEVQFPAIIGDVRSALIWVARYGRDYGISSNRLVLMGHSAGAHMATLLDLDPRYLDDGLRRRIMAVVAMAGPYDFLPFTESYEPVLFGPPERFADSQPVSFVKGTEAPMLLLYGEADTRIKPRNILSLSEKVRQRGGRVQTRCYPGIDHSGILAALSRPLRSTEPVYADILHFLDQVGEGGAVNTGSNGSCNKLARAA